MQHVKDGKQANYGPIITKWIRNFSKSIYKNIAVDFGGHFITNKLEVGEQKILLTFAICTYVRSYIK